MKLPIPFNNPATYPGHTGVDYGQRLDTPIRASGSGVIKRRTYNERAGYAVWVQYDDMPVGDEVGYCHLDDYSQSPPIGTRVVEGTVIGLVGNTGKSTGPHLHSEVRNHPTTDGYWKFFNPNRVVGSLITETDDLMKIFSVNGGFYISFPDGIVGIRNPPELELLRKFLRSTPGNEPSFSPYERDVINYYLTAPRLNWNDLNK